MIRISFVRAASTPLELLGMWALWITATSAGVAAEPAKASSDRLAQTIAGTANECRLFMGANRIPLERRAEPVLRWPNATRDTPDGATFLWTHDGRPAALACIWQYGGSLYGIAFHSLSTQPLIAERRGATLWHPNEAGIAFRSFPSAPTPADTPAKRLSQMRELGRRFKCRLVGGGGSEQLRMLPQPVYRYQVDRQEIVDGALFAFVQGTDPEVILMLEAAPQDGKLAWRYALTRRTVVALEAALDGAPVWSVPAGAGGPGATWFQTNILPAL